MLETREAEVVALRERVHALRAELADLRERYDEMIHINIYLKSCVRGRLRPAAPPPAPIFTQ